MSIEFDGYIHSCMSLLLANHLASTETLVHSKTKYRNMNVGENLRCQSWPMTGDLALLISHAIREIVIDRQGNDRVMVQRIDEIRLSQSIVPSGYRTFYADCLERLARGGFRTSLRRVHELCCGYVLSTRQLHRRVQPKRVRCSLAVV